MFRQLLIVGFIAYCAANGYGGGNGDGYGSGAHIMGAIRSTHHVSVVPIHSNYKPSGPTVVHIGAGEQPVIMSFNTQSGPLHPSQSHIGEPGTVQQTSSVDEPHRLVHEVTRPVVQEFREVITPFRSEVQEIRPVQENVETVVAQGQGNGNADGLIATDMGAVIGGSLGDDLSGGLGAGSLDGAGIGGISAGNRDAGNGDAGYGVAGNGDAGYGDAGYGVAVNGDAGHGIAGNGDMGYVDAGNRDAGYVDAGNGEAGYVGSGNGDAGNKDANNKGASNRNAGNGGANEAVYGGYVRKEKDIRTYKD